MNQRIEEFTALAREHANSYDDEGGPAWFQFYNEKLTELIVKECTTMLPADSVRDENGVHMFYVIREHFGI